MDALTHAVIGVAVGGFSGHPLSWHDPVYIAAILGSQAPDFDCVTRLAGQISYLKHHRAFSHSLPGVLLWSSLIAAGFYLFNPAIPSAEVFFWSFLGGFSHILMDFLNTHGSAILWPYRKERKSCNLLNVFDPVLLALLLSLYIYRMPMQYMAIASTVIIAVYAGVRHFLKRRAASRLNNHFGGDTGGSLLVMPCLTRISYWDFLVKTDTMYYIGRISALRPLISIQTELPNRETSGLSSQVQQSAVGRFFSTFTPFSYCAEYAEADQTTVRIYDLRYYNKARFIHSGTIIFRDHQIPAHAYIQSYGNRIYMPY